jgi:hypothetical protein
MEFEAMSRKIPLFVFGSLIAASASAQSGPVLTIDDVLLEREVVPFIDLSMLADYDVTLRGDVNVRRRDDDSIWVDVPLERSHGARFTLKVAVDISCSHRALKAYVSDVDFDSDNVRAWFFQTIPGLVDRIELGVEESMTTNLFPGLPTVPSCPAVRVLSDGALRLDFGFHGDQCSSGERRHLPCGGISHGSGIDLVCANGVWESAGADCEPDHGSSESQL